MDSSTDVRSEARMHLYIFLTAFLIMHLFTYQYFYDARPQLHTLFILFIILLKEILLNLVFCLIWYEFENFRTLVPRSYLLLLIL